MLTLGYTPSVVNLDITDIRHPKLIGEVKLIPPFPNTLTQSIHTVVPLWDRKLIAGHPRGALRGRFRLGHLDPAG